jgi:hypothetical protein
MRNFDGRSTPGGDLMGFVTGPKEEGRVNQEAVLWPSSSESCIEFTSLATLGAQG